MFGEGSGGFGIARQQREKVVETVGQEAEAHGP
jgi:hypothetical protein